MKEKPTKQDKFIIALFRNGSVATREEMMELLNDSWANVKSLAQNLERRLLIEISSDRKRKNAKIVYRLNNLRAYQIKKILEMVGEKYDEQNRNY